MRRSHRLTASDSDSLPHTSADANDAAAVGGSSRERGLSRGESVSTTSTRTLVVTSKAIDAALQAATATATATSSSGAGGGGGNANRNARKNVQEPIADEYSRRYQHAPYSNP